MMHLVKNSGFSAIFGHKIVNIRLFILQYHCFKKKAFPLRKTLKIKYMNKEEMSMLAAIVADQVVKRLKSVRNLSETEYVGAEEAARILGVSANYLRQVKDRYPHIKAGNRKQGRIMFKRDALLNEFKNA